MVMLLPLALIAQSFLFEAESQGVNIQLVIDWSNPSATLSNGDRCDLNLVDSTCDTFFLICVKRVSSSSCDVFKETTKIYKDVWAVKADNTEPSIIPLNSTFAEPLEISIDAWDYDAHTSNDFMARFKSTFETKFLTRNWTAIPLYRVDLGYRNNVTMKAFARMECADGYCDPRCKPKSGVNSCDAMGNYICENGFTGPKCEQRNFCENHNCAPYATCQSLTNGYKCVCGAYEGNVCENGYDACQGSGRYECGSHGRCRSQGPEFVCDCDPDWEGARCEHPAGPCAQAALALSPSPVCLNGGICRTTDDGKSYVCQCPRQYSGARCDFFEDCASRNCSSHGECVYLDERNGIFRCECNYGWSGIACERRILTPCEVASRKLGTDVSMVCFHGGNCIDNPNGVDFSCDCHHGWFGKQCEVFFTQTPHFIVALVMAFLIVLMVLAANVRKIQRMIHPQMSEPLTYTARRTEPNQVNSTHSIILPYATFIPGNNSANSTNYPNFCIHGSGVTSGSTPAIPFRHMRTPSPLPPS